MVIYFHKAGQLANRLFAASHLLANAKENDYRLLLLSLDEYSPFYQGTKGRKISSKFAYGIALLFFKSCIKIGLRKSPFHQIIVAEIPEFSFGESTTYRWDAKNHYDLRNNFFLRTVKQKPIIILFGRFFRDHRSIKEHKGTIRSFFTPIKSITNKVERHVSKVRVKSDLLVGVHIRKGDYRYFKGGKYDYSIRQYITVLNDIHNNIFDEKKLAYIICSNEQIDNHVFEDLPYEVRQHNGTPYEDLYCLSCCDYIVGPPSTFSLWASFLKNTPLYHIKDPEKQIRIEDFVVSDSEKAYEFIIE